MNASAAPRALIHVEQLVGPNAVTREDGRRLADAVRPFLCANTTVTLDMRGVNVLASPFLLGFMSPLLNEFPVPQLNQQIQFLGLAFHHKELAKRVSNHIKTIRTIH